MWPPASRFRFAPAAAARDAFRWARYIPTFPKGFRFPMESRPARSMGGIAPWVDRFARSDRGAYTEFESTARRQRPVRILRSERLITLSNI